MFSTSLLRVSGPPPSDLLARFVTQLQLLLTEGEFVSTYKLALLIALARWATENPDYDEDSPLDVQVLAGHFVELYWPHVLPFRAPAAAVAEGIDVPGGGLGWGGVLAQDRGQHSEHQMPRVLKELRRVRAGGVVAPHQLAAKQRDDLWRKVRRAIADQPLWKLHKLRGNDRPMRFLYHRGANDYQLVFEPGVVACLAHLAPLIEDTVRAAWLRFVVRCNPAVLGPVADLEAFLFPESRASLSVWRAPLQEVQDDRCFYCGGALAATPVIDHFLPWVRYPRDLGHNFVLAHAGCNQDKSDHLASVEHLGRWCERNATRGTHLARRFDELHLPHDWPTLRGVATSLYQLAEAGDALVWHRGRALVALDKGWRRALAAS
jgi:hypothetical protein